MDKPNVFDTPDRVEHRRKRQAVGQVVSEKSLRSFEPTILEQIDIFLSELHQSSLRGEAVNMTTNCKRLAADVVGLLSFGYPLNTQTDVTNRLVPEAMCKAIYMVNVFFNWPTLGYFGPLLRWIGRRRAQHFYNIIERMITARQSEPKHAKADFYSIAVDKESGDGLYHDELWPEALFFVLAGGTTVATAMCGVFFHLARHPKVYSRLCDEIRQDFSSAQEIRLGQKLSNCKYLRAVIDEALRISPPSLTPIWREPEATYNQPLIVDGHVIPRGTQVSIHLYSILHDEKYFPEPFLFRPERWLELEDETPSSSTTQEQREVQATMRRAQVNFGLGERNCAGKSMAYMETSLVIARTLWHFDFESAPGKLGTLGQGQARTSEPWDQPDQFELFDILIAEHDGPNLVFKTRTEIAHEMKNE